MKRIGFMLTLFAALLAFGLGAAENQRFAVVDLEKVFREFYKSRIAEDAIKSQSEIYRAYLLKLNEQLQQLQKEAATLLLNAQNIALTETERRDSVRAAEAKKREVDEKKAEIELYGTERSQDLRRMEQGKRVEVMNEIMAEVRRRAAAEGYGFVLDSSGRTMNDQPAVLVFPPADDITAQVIAELNRTRTAPQPTNPNEGTK